MENTRDLAKFGGRERAIAGELLSVLHTGNDNTKWLNNTGLAVEFNLSTGFVFLVDDDYNVALMQDGKLVDWNSCPDCGTEGTISDLKSMPKLDDCCKEYITRLED